MADLIAPRMPSYGDRVATASGATGRYLGDGLVLLSSLTIERVDTRGRLITDPDYPVPTGRDLDACRAGLDYVSLLEVIRR